MKYVGRLHKLDIRRFFVQTMNPGGVEFEKKIAVEVFFLAEGFLFFSFFAVKGRRLLGK